MASELPAHTRIDWQPILNLLEEFRHSFVNCPPLDLQFLTDRMWSTDHFNEWVKRIDGSRKSPGIYLHFDEHGCLIYVGKASASSCIENRVWTHDESPKFIDRPRRWTYLIPFTQADDAPKVTMLEELLIKKLQPIHNVNGR